MLTTPPVALRVPEPEGDIDEATLSVAVPVTMPPVPDSTSELSATVEPFLKVVAPAVWVKLPVNE